MTNEVALAMRDFFVGSIQHDVKTTMNVLRAVPDDPNKWTYKPDPKARNAWELAWHLAGVDVHFCEGIPNLSFADMANEGAFLKLHEPKSIATMVAWYEKEMARVLGRVSSMTAEQLATPVQFFMYNQPSVEYLAFVKSHSIHHRGELATYLRPMGSKCPSIYGPSADENPFA